MTTSAPEGKASAQTPSDRVTGAHGHGDRRVTEESLQAEDIPSPHHVMAGEGVAQDVG